MSEIRRTEQGGSIVTFIVVGAILVLGLVGTIYFVKKHSEQARKDQAIAALGQQQTNQSNTGNTSTGNAKKVTDNSSKETKNTTKKSTSLPKTGAELSISELVGTYLLTTATVGYVSSRRYLARSL